MVINRYAQCTVVVLNIIVLDRLETRLDMYGLVEKAVMGDGNCQFRALADQLYRTADMHADVRRTVVHQLRACSEVNCTSVLLHGPPAATLMCARGSGC